MAKWAVPVKLDYNHSMRNAFILLYMFFSLGLLSLALLYWTARRQAVRTVIFVLSLLVVNLGTLFVLLAVFGVSRLEGSTPPGIGEVLGVFWFPILLILAVDAAVVMLNSRIKARFDHPR